MSCCYVDVKRIWSLGLRHDEKKVHWNCHIRRCPDFCHLCDDCGENAAGPTTSDLVTLCCEVITWDKLDLFALSLLGLWMLKASSQLSLVNVTLRCHHSAIGEMSQVLLHDYKHLSVLSPRLSFIWSSLHLSSSHEVKSTSDFTFSDILMWKFEGNLLF